MINFSFGLSKIDVISLHKPDLTLLHLKFEEPNEKESFVFKSNEFFVILILILILAAFLIFCEYLSW